MKGLGTAMAGLGILVWAGKSLFFSDDEETQNKAESYGEQFVQWLEGIMLAELSLEVSLAAIIKSASDTVPNVFGENSIRAATFLTIYAGASSATMLLKISILEPRDKKRTITR